MSILCHLRRSVAALSIILGFAVTTSSAYAEPLTIYSTRQPFLIEHLLDEFRAKTGVEVKVLYAKKGLIERLKLEGMNSPADILLTNNTLWLIEAKQAGLTQAIDRPKVRAAIPENLIDTDRQWVGLTRRGRVIYANEDTVPMGAVQDYLDLASPENDYRVCLRSWRHPYNIGLVAYLLTSIGEAETEKWIRGVQAKLGRPPQGNDRAQIRAVNAGECDVAIANSYYFGVMKSDPNQVGDTLKVYSIFPSLDSKYGSFSFISGAALLKSADNVETAGRLIDYLVSPGAQILYARENHEFPANRLFLGMRDDELRLDNRSLSDVLAKRGAALDLINRILG